MKQMSRKQIRRFVEKQKKTRTAAPLPHEMEEDELRRVTGGTAHAFLEHEEEERRMHKFLKLRGARAHLD